VEIGERALTVAQRHDELRARSIADEMGRDASSGRAV
jgi:hypothetical protein